MPVKHNKGGQGQKLSPRTPQDVAKQGLPKPQDRGEAEKFGCPDCNYTVKSIYGLGLHKYQYCEVSRVKEAPPIKEKVQCPDCHYVVANVYQFGVHKLINCDRATRSHKQQQSSNLEQSPKKRQRLQQPHEDDEEEEDCDYNEEEDGDELDEEISGN